MLDPIHVQKALAGHSVRTIAQEALHPCAVLLLLYAKEEEDCILFTRRTEHLSHHGGEISFPGGRKHSEDVNLVDTALRETEEEMGIFSDDVMVLGRLDDCVSVYGYHVVPFVGTFPYPYPFRVNDQEIAEVIEVPIALLRDPAIFRKEDWRHSGRLHPVCFYTVGKHQIWGLTAGILRQFLERVFNGQN
jgi:8-oxo-dGTP pyrophosphatase MutT (NUDIX family)